MAIYSVRGAFLPSAAKRFPATAPLKAGALPKEKTMTPETKAKWAKRSAIKTALLDSGVSINRLSGRILNVEAGLPHDAVWREGNFA